MQQIHPGKPRGHSHLPVIYAILVMVYVLSSLLRWVEYLLLYAKPRSEAYPLMVVYPICSTEMVMDSPRCMSIIFFLNDVLSIFLLSLYVSLCKDIQDFANLQVF